MPYLRSLHEMGAGIMDYNHVCVHLIKIKCVCVYVCVCMCVCVCVCVYVCV